MKHEKEMQVMGREVERTDRTGWFNRTGWPEHFKERNLAHLAHAVRLPGNEEVKLKRAARVVELLIEQSVAGLASLERETRRWLKTAKREEIDQRPMARLQNPESQARYTMYYVMFVCYVLRLVEDEERRAADTARDEFGEQCSDTSSVTSSEDESGDEPTVEGDPLKGARALFPWRGRQKELARTMWSALDGADEGVQKATLLRLLTSFIFEGTNGDPFSSGLVHFVAVLGIDAGMGRLRLAPQYSYMLAGVVYCTRVLAIEALLPSARRQSQGVEDREKVLRTRREFLADGSYSPMSEMLSLLAYGKHIAMNSGSSGNAFWSADKEIFYHRGRPIVIRKFQQMVRDIVEEVEDKLWDELLWVDGRDQRFTIKLEDIVDDVTFTKRGMSFIHREENGLQGGLEWMLNRVIQADVYKLRSKASA